MPSSRAHPQEEMAGRVTSVLVPTKAKRKPHATPLAPTAAIPEDIEVPVASSPGQPSGSAPSPPPAVTEANLTNAVLQGQVDVDALLRARAGKGIEGLRAEIMSLDHRASEDLKRLVQDNYKELLSASESVMKLDGELSSLRKAINASTGMLQALRQLVDQPGAVNTPTTHAGGGWGVDGGMPSVLEDPLDMLWADSAHGRQWYTHIDTLDAAIGERELDAALTALTDTRRLLKSIVSGDPGSANASPRAAARQQQLEGQLEKRVTQLRVVLENMTKDPAAARMELCALSLALRQVAGVQVAHTALLAAHSARMARQQQLLTKPQHSGGADVDGCEYASALCQQLFFGLAEALEDVSTCSRTVNAPELNALTVTWIAQEAESVCGLLKTFSLEHFAAAAGLPATVKVVQLALVYAKALEQSHHIRVSHVVWRVLWPSLEGALNRFVRKHNEQVQEQLLTDISKVTAPGFVIPDDVSSWASIKQLFPHLLLFSEGLHQLTTLLVPIAGPQLGSFVRKTVSSQFQAYCRVLQSGVQPHLSARGTVPDSIAPGVDLLLEGAALLLEQIIPKLLRPLAAMAGDPLDLAHLNGVLDSTATALGLVEAPA